MKKINSKKVLYVLDLIIIFIVIYFCIGYINFTKIRDNQDPLFNGVLIEKNNNKNNIKVYKYGIYKIIKNEKKNSNVSYSMKLWFSKDE